ncbi:hypothetical protein CMI37_11380 [Candidatus Pacearchaeota archaeon]|nr:hypothetical protein [Candidatus Pacearchaeota archaeon]
MNPRRRLMWKMKARAAKKSTPDVVVASVTPSTVSEPTIEEVVTKVKEEIAAEVVQEEIVAEVAVVEPEPVVSAPRKVKKGRNTRKTATTKKKW